MTILDEIAKAWGWRDVKPQAFVMENAFGNVIFIDVEGRYWRICPEELSCDLIALDDRQYQRRFHSAEFQTDWDMESLVRLAHSTVGPLPEGRCYCLKIAGVLGGSYCADNLGTIPREEAIRFSGFLGEKIKDLPNGSKIRQDVDNDLPSSTKK